MCPPSQRADALNALTLVENIARLATQGLFGFVFSALAASGKAYLTFFCNAVSIALGYLCGGRISNVDLMQSVALLGVGVLIFSHFPSVGSRLVEDGCDEDAEAEDRRE
jgi:hypothetical protein